MYTHITTLSYVSMHLPEAKCVHAFKHPPPTHTMHLSNAHVCMYECFNMLTPHLHHLPSAAWVAQLVVPAMNMLCSLCWQIYQLKGNGVGKAMFH